MGHSHGTQYISPAGVLHIPFLENLCGGLQFRVFKFRNFPDLQEHLFAGFAGSSPGTLMAERVSPAAFNELSAQIFCL